MNPSPPPRTALSLRSLGIVAGVFLTIWSVKLATIARYGTDIPYWDQWAKEGELFFAPWFEHHAFWSHVFVPHNEHRIAPTLALNLGLVRLGGNQWDARVQCVASAALHAALLAGLAAWALRRFGATRGGAGAAPSAPQTAASKADHSPRAPVRRCGSLAAVGVCWLLVLLGAPPLAWENVLGGFQSQFYFLAIFSLLALGGLLGTTRLSWRWWGGLAAMGLALVSMGSGMLVAVPVALVAGVRVIVGRGRRHAVATLAAALLLGGIGWWLRPQAPWHAPIHAHSLMECARYLARCLAWPLYDRPWLSVVFWGPWLALCFAWARTVFRAWRSCINQTASGDFMVDFIVAGGVWVLVQIAAVSYSRGATGIPAPRYGDICALGLAFNGFAAAWFARRRQQPEHEIDAEIGEETDATLPSSPRGVGRVWPSWLATMGTLLWTATVVIAVGFATREVLRDPLPRKAAEATGYARNVQAFVLTDDYATFEKATPLPFPMADWLARILRHPAIRPLLPQSIRAPLAVPGLANRAEAAPLPSTPSSPVRDAGQPSPAGATFVDLPVLDHRATRVLSAPAEWRSAPIRAHGGWWKIEMAGDTANAAVTLELLSAADGRILARFAPSRPPGNTWRAAYARVPDQPVVLHAHVTAPALRLAFSEPIEVSTLSFWTWRLVEHAGWLAVLGLGMLLIFGVDSGGASHRRR